MDKKKMMRNIFQCVSVALTIGFAFFGIFFLVLAAVRSLWFLALAFICALCSGGAAGVAFYFGED